MVNTLCDIKDIRSMIQSGKHLLLAGDEVALRQLPKGSWIAGTIPYFVGDQGGVQDQRRIYATELPEYIVSASIKVYDEKNIHKVYEDGPSNGFSVIIIPATSPTHLTFALKAPQFPSFANSPLIGWISGVLLADLGKVTPKVFDGRNISIYENGAVVFHIQLPANKITDIGIINIFEQGEGDEITFPHDSFSITEAVISGKKTNFAQYLKEKQIDTKLPLVADFYGSMINTSFQGINEAGQRVDLYAPVFSGITYKIARPVGDYVSSFETKVPKDSGGQLFFSCNCILNYLYAELPGKKTVHFVGPITFGEVAYQLLNQTLTYINIENI
jgi:hypothetical protein